MMKISEICEQCEISASTLRYYERIGLLPPIARGDSGIRDYSELDVRRVQFIKCMRNAGLPVNELIKYYQLVQQGDETMPDRKEILIEQRMIIGNQMAELQKTLDLLDYKINHYEQAVLQAEKAFIEAEE